MQKLYYILYYVIYTVYIYKYKIQANNCSNTLSSDKHKEAEKCNKEQ